MNEISEYIRKYEYTSFKLVLKSDILFVNDYVLNTSNKLKETYFVILNTILSFIDHDISEVSLTLYNNNIYVDNINYKTIL